MANRSIICDTRFSIIRLFNRYSLDFWNWPNFHKVDNIVIKPALLRYIKYRNANNLSWDQWSRWFPGYFSWQNGGVQKAVREVTNLSETNKLNQGVKLKPLNYKYKFYQNIVRLILHCIAWQQGSGVYGKYFALCEQILNF